MKNLIRRTVATFVCLCRPIDIVSFCAHGWCPLPLGHSGWFQTAGGGDGERMEEHGHAACSRDAGSRTDPHPLPPFTIISSPCIHAFPCLPSFFPSLPLSMHAFYFPLPFLRQAGGQGRDRARWTGFCMSLSQLMLLPAVFFLCLCVCMPLMHHFCICIYILLSGRHTQAKTKGDRKGMEEQDRELTSLEVEDALLCIFLHPSHCIHF